MTSFDKLFALTPVKEKHSNPVRSLSTWRDLYFVGTESKIQVFEMNRGEKRVDSVMRFMVTRARAGDVQQIALVPEKSIMVVLWGETLALHALPAYEMIAGQQHVQSNCMEMVADGIPDQGDVGGFHIKRDNGRYYLATFSSKKVFVYSFDDRLKKFTRIHEFVPPEKPRAIAWCGKRLMLALKESYTLLAITGEVEDVCPTAKRGRCVLNLEPRGEFIVAMDTAGPRLPVHSAPSPSRACTWASAPLWADYIDPFVLTLHGTHTVDVHYPFAPDCGRHSLLHSITQKDVYRISQRSFVTYDTKQTPLKDQLALLRRDPVLVADAANSIYLFEMLPIKEQVEHVAAQKDFVFAMELCRRCSSEIPEQTLRDVLRDYGFHCLSDTSLGSLPDRLRVAMERFKEGETDPRLVIQLFPNFLPQEIQREIGKERVRLNEMVSDSRIRDECLKILVPFLESQRRPVRDTPGTTLKEEQSRQTAVDTAMVKALVWLRREDTLLTFLQGPHHAAVSDGSSFLAERGQWVALAALQRSRGLHRAAVDNLMALGSTGAPRREVSTLPPLQGQRVLNLLAGFERSELVTKKFLPTMAIERRVLDQLKQTALSLEERQRLVAQAVGVCTCLTYLRTALDLTNPLEKQIHLECSKWLLRDLPPEVSISLYTQLDNPAVPAARLANLFDPKLVIEELSAAGSGATSSVALVSTYLQHVLGENCDEYQDEELHNRRVRLLIELVHEQRGFEEKKATPAEVSLLHFLERSRWYNPDIVEKWLEQGPYSKSLYKQRALVYQRLGAHSKAISMFLHDIKSLSEAQLYATKASKDDSDAFKILLLELTRSSPTDSAEAANERAREALRVVNTCEGVDAQTALPMLSGDTPIAELTAFMMSSLRSSHTKRRNLELHAAISQANLRDAEFTLLQSKKRCVLIDESAVCIKCGFKIRKDTMFAVFPNGDKAHQLCYDDEHIHPTSKKDFRNGIHTIFHREDHK